MSAALLDRLHGQSIWWPRLALLAALLLALWLAVRLFWLLLAGPTLPPLPPAAATTDTTFTAPAPTGSIAQWHLFGTAQPGINLGLLAEQAPETALKLTLRGTLSVDHPDGGIAIIADEQGVDRAYRVGDSLPSDARLEAIHAGRVLLSRGGQTEALSLPRDADLASTTPSGNARRAAGRPVQADGSAYPGFVNPAIAPGAPVLQTQRALAGADLQALAKEVNVLPVIENGRFAGVRLSVGRNSELLTKTGLRSSDVVTAVNGIPLDGPQRQVELMNSLRDARQVTLSVRRDGKTIQIPVGL